MGHERGKNPQARIGGAKLTRRSLFELSGLALATAALPPGVTMAEPSAEPERVAQNAGPVMDKLSTYMSEASGRALPDEVVEKAKHHILDTLAAMISGSELLPGRDAIQFVHAYGGKEVATVVASSVLCGPIEAALTN
jgi:hypothetical protein